MPSVQMTALGLEERKPSKNKFRRFICNNEGHRQTQFKANELCGSRSSIFSCAPFAFFFFAQLWVLSMHEVMNSGGISMWKTANWHSHTHSLGLKSKSYCRDSQWNKNIRHLFPQFCLKDCEFVESGLEMPKSLQLIADALFMRLPKPSLK